MSTFALIALISLFVVLGYIAFQTTRKLNQERIAAALVKTKLLHELQEAINTNIRDYGQQRREYQLTLNNLVLEHREALKAARADALSKSEAVRKGQTAEQFAPWALPWASKDYRHIGDPIDFLVYVGYDALRAGQTDTLEEIIFLDIKTASAGLNKGQRRIRDAIVAGKVSFATYNPDTTKLRFWPPRPEAIQEELNDADES